MIKVPITGKSARGRVTLVDEEDLELVSGYRWRISEGPTGIPYAVTYMPNPGHTGRGRSNYPMHRLITGFLLTDHKNGDTLDNRRSNLREADYLQNRWNSKPCKKTRTGFKGVNWSGEKTHSWQARIMKEGERIFLGNFATPEDAARAYDAAARTLFGEFARVNFPDDPYAEMPIREVRYCARLDCGKELPDSKQINAIYCSRSCASIMSKRAWRKRMVEN